MAIVLTLIFWLIYISSTLLRQFIDSDVNYQFTMEAFGYAFVVTVFTFSALVYLVTRQGALQRFQKHTRVPRYLLDQHFSQHQPSITVLIPSYNEETSVIRKTILSAALQEYPKIRVVLLIDDNPNPKDPIVANKLNATRNLIDEINKLLSQPHKHLQKSLTKFQTRTSKKKVLSIAEIKELANNYQWASDWLVQLAEKEIIEDHVDDFFANQVIRELANELKLNTDAIEMSLKEGVILSKDRVTQLYQRLIWIFSVELSYFERKRFASLSQEANKAMNLNSYIGLMGGRYRPENTPEGIVLIPTTKKDPKSISFPDSEFLLTLDADSILLREYCLRLVYLLQQPENSRVAVTQTPYSSFKGAPSPLERLSGATTDVQHVLHQGMTHFNATFWVGANAVIRKRALEDIVEKEIQGGFEIKRYVQDRTVIEDTESSIDLAVHGWKLLNYPERLSYSATPPDFGSLIVQRRRWANGGLLILPKLLTHIQNSKNKETPVSIYEIIIRINYMASIAWSSLGLMFILAYPYDGRLLSPFVFLAALPYYIAMAYDFKYCGYKYSDIFRVYGFNLILLPVNIAGVIKSIEQAFTGKKIPFARTPKVKNRTASELIFVVAPILIVAFSLFTMYRNIIEGNWINASVATFNAFAATWAIFAYIGIFNLATDIWLGLTNWLYVETKPQTKKITTNNNQDFNWRAVLYHGEKNTKIPQHLINDLTINQTYLKNNQILS